MAGLKFPVNWDVIEVLGPVEEIACGNPCGE